MRFTKKRRTDNYFGLLQNTYETLQVGDYECQKFQTSRSLPYYMQELGWVELVGRRVKWNLPAPPTKSMAITLMDFATQRTTEYSKRAKEKRENKAVIAQNRILFNQVVMQEKFSFDEWVQKLKSDPEWEYKLTRTKRIFESEIII